MVCNANGTTVTWNAPFVTGGTLDKQPDTVLYDKKRNDLPTDRYKHIR